MKKAPVWLQVAISFAIFGIGCILIGYNLNVLGGIFCVFGIFFILIMALVFRVKKKLKQQ